MDNHSDEYTLKALTDMLDKMYGNTGFEPVSHGLSWSVQRALEYVAAEEHEEAVSILERARKRFATEAKIEVNTGITKINKLPRVTLDIMSEKAARLTGNLGAAFLKLFDYALANVAPTKVLLGESKETGTIVMVFDKLKAEGFTMLDLLGKINRVRIRVPATDIAGHGSLATGANVQVSHASRTLRRLGLANFDPHVEDSLRAATFQIFDQGKWAAESSDFDTQVGESAKVRFIFRHLPSEVFQRPSTAPPWVHEIFRNLNRYAAPQLMNPASLHPEEDTIYHFAGGIENYGPRSQYVLYAGKKTSIPTKGQQPTTHYLFFSALSPDGPEYEISQDKLMLRLRLQRNVRCLVPRPIGFEAEETDAKATGEPQPESTTSPESSPESTPSPAEAKAAESTSAAGIQTGFAAGIQTGLVFKVGDEAREAPDPENVILAAADNAYPGIRARVAEAVMENGNELTVRYELSVNQDSMLHSNTGLLVLAHARAEPAMNRANLMRFYFVNQPVKGGRHDARDYKINLIKGRSLTVVVSYEMKPEGEV